jgi:Flp pilus assembly protein TadG
MQRLVKADAGQAVLEAAICLPILCLLLVGVIDLGRLSQFDTKLASAARAGAQYGAQNLETADDLTGQQVAAENDISNMAGTTATASAPFCTCYGSTGNVSCTATACSTSHRLLFVSVKVSGTFKPMFNYFINTATLHSRTATLQVGQ